jgi:ketosteroid isomerase-like protein
MTKVWILICLFVLASVGAYAAEPGLSEADTAFQKAFQSNDLEGVMALYGEDSQLFPPDEMTAKGVEAIRKNYETLMKNFTIKSFQVVESHRETSGNLSLCWGQFTLDLEPKAGGDPVHMEGRFSDVSRKVKGKWQYVVDHASVPFAPPPAPAPNQ